MRSVERKHKDNKYLLFLFRAFLDISVSNHKLRFICYRIFLVFVWDHGGNESTAMSAGCVAWIAGGLVGLNTLASRKLDRGKETEWEGREGRVRKVGLTGCAYSLPSMKEMLSLHSRRQRDCLLGFKTPAGRGRLETGGKRTNSFSPSRVSRILGQTSFSSCKITSCAGGGNDRC